MIPKACILLSVLTVACGAFNAGGDPDQVAVTIATELGDIEVALHPTQAPLTVSNFLRYVDAGQYDNGRFHRAVTLGNQPDRRIKIEVIQGGPLPSRRLDGFPPILLERSKRSGLLHLDGTLSMARSKPDSARSDFFICIGAQPSLDYGGLRNPDGQGFAAFGHVVEGMSVVRAIQVAAKDGQRLTPAIRILAIRRNHRRRPDRH